MDRAQGHEKAIHPNILQKKEENGERIHPARQAEAAAKHLADQQWGHPTDPLTDPRNLPEPEHTKNKFLNDHPPEYHTGHITITEISEVIHKSKRNKAAGPDEIEAEVLKALDDHSLKMLEHLFNDWYQGEQIDPTALEARVVLIFKKGDPSSFSNFRPISLLNTITKVHARILKKRLSDGFEK